MVSSEPVSEALLPVYNQLQTLKRCLIEVKNSGGVSSPRELYPYSMKVSIPADEFMIRANQSAAKLDRQHAERWEVHGRRGDPRRAGQRERAAGRMLRAQLRAPGSRRVGGQRYIEGGNRARGGFCRRTGGVCGSVAICLDRLGNIFFVACKILCVGANS